MRECNSARRDRRHVHRERLRPHVFARHPGLVADVIPAARPAASADDGDSVPAFDRRAQVFECFAHDVSSLGRYVILNPASKWRRTMAVAAPVSPLLTYEEDMAEPVILDRYAII